MATHINMKDVAIVVRRAVIHQVDLAAHAAQLVNTKVQVVHRFAYSANQVSIKAARALQTAYAAQLGNIKVVQDLLAVGTYLQVGRVLSIFLLL